MQYKLIKIKFILLFSLSIIGTICLYANDNNLRFRNLSSNDGLSFNTVTAITQDYKGRMWIATVDGLNLYDGNQFTVFRHDDKNPNSLSNNYVSAITEDPYGKLWIGTNVGISIYDPEKNQFTNINKKLKISDSIVTYISAIVFDKYETVWIGSGLGLYRINYKTMAIELIKTDLINENITALYLDKNNNLWIGNDKNGLVFYDKTKNKFILYNNFENENNVTTFNTTRAIIEDNRGVLWVGTDQGLHEFDKKSNTFTKHYYNPKNPISPLKKMVRSLFKDNRNRIWVGFQYGLTIFDVATNTFTKIENDVYNPYSISSDEVWCMTQDKKGSIWFGFYSSGISIFDYDKAKFESFRNNPNNPNSIAANAINTFCEDSLGNIWIGTTHNGLDYYNFKNKSFTHYKNDPHNPNSISSDAILSIDKDHEGIFWIGTWGGGLNRFDPIKKKFTNYIPKPNDTNSINDIHIWRAIEDKHNNLLIAAQQEGLSYFIREKNIFKTFKRNPENPKSLANNFVNHIYRDKQENIWIGTSRGLCKLENDQFDFKTYLPRKYIYDIYNDNRGTLWVGSGSGLYAIDLKSEKTTLYTIEHGLGSNSVVGIVEDSQKNLWVSTVNGGISRINTETKRIRNFTTGDGLPSVSFKKRARLKLSDGRMLFGTTEGFILFNPDSIKDSIAPPKLILSDFLIFNKSVNGGEKGSPLKKHITFSDTIILDHDQSVFSIYYAAMNFVSPEENKYAYILQGFEKEWNYVGSKRDATYTNLDPGEYKFRVKVSIYRNFWNPEEASVTIIFLPPFYETWWFRALALLFTISVLLVIYYYRLRRIRKANELLTKLVDERTAELARKNEMLFEQTEMLSHTNQLLNARRIEIEEMNTILIDQAEQLHDTNALLEERQMQIEEQTEELLVQKEELTTQRNNLNELNITKDKLFSILGHDLRTPFNSILGYSDLLYNNLRKYSLDKIETQVGFIKDTARSTFYLLNNLLEWARSQQGNLNFMPEEISVKEIIDSELRILSQQANRKEVKLNLSKKGKESTIEADPNMIATVIRNLVSNAIKYSLKGNTIQIVLDYKKDSFTFSVKDEGLGMNAEKVNMLFKVKTNTSTRGTEGEKGTGLGLILCADFISIHNGNIMVESEEFKGSTFSFSIPVKQNINY
jgi:ligand-binding sensor domain-containing protein/signal transduction histidine kinase